MNRMAFICMIKYDHSVKCSDCCYLKRLKFKWKVKKLG